MKQKRILLSACVGLLSVLGCWGATREVTVQLRGVHSSNITLTPFNGVRFALPLQHIDSVLPGNRCRFIVPDSLLPGEFLLRFDYRAKAGDAPYPAEMQFYLNRENIRLYAHPLHLSGDSLRMEGDVENTVWNGFQKTNMLHRQQIGLLEQLLGNYTRRNSKLYAVALKEYEDRRVDYNRWLDSMTVAHRDCYVSHLFKFQQIGKQNWLALPADRVEGVAAHWFDGFNFNDTTVLRSRQMGEFINGYLSLYGMRATSEAIRDSLFTQAGRQACRLASAGNPKVYGWFVDYFYLGYETYNITSGLRMLEEHQNNPRCLTSKKMEIARRLAGLKNQLPGTQCANLLVHDFDDRPHTINLQGNTKKQLVLFYESDCGHCIDLLAELTKWYAEPEHAAALTVYTIALDDTRQHWEPAFLKNKFPWTDRWAPGGVNSQAAADYYMLSTPSLFLLDENGKLLSIPTSVEGLDKSLRSLIP